MKYDRTSKHVLLLLFCRILVSVASTSYTAHSMLFLLLYAACTRCCWFIESDVYFSSLKRVFFKCIPWQYTYLPRRHYDIVWPTTLTITMMHGAAGGRQLATANTLLESHTYKPQAF